MFSSCKSRLLKRKCFSYFKNVGTALKRKKKALESPWRVLEFCFPVPVKTLLVLIIQTQTKTFIKNPHEKSDKHTELKWKLPFQARSKKRKAMVESSSSDEDNQPLKRRTVACVDQSENSASSSFDEDFMESVPVKAKVFCHNNSQNHKGSSVPVRGKAGFWNVENICFFENPEILVWQFLSADVFYMMTSFYYSHLSSLSYCGLILV